MRNLIDLACADLIVSNNARTLENRVQKGPNIAYVIYEQPLSQELLLFFELACRGHHGVTSSKAQLSRHLFKNVTFGFALHYELN